MRTRRAGDALIGLGYLVVIAALVALSLAVYNKAFTSYVNVDVSVPAAGDSLATGAEVMVRGILVGEVHEITTGGQEVDLHLQLDPAKVHSLPANMTVQLLPQTLFGQSFVNLVLPARPTGQLRSGQTLQHDDSPGTVAMEQVFRKLQYALTAVQPGKLSASLGELAAALRGHGKDLGLAFKALGQFFHGLSPHIPHLVDDLNRLVSVARTYDTAAPDLLRGLATFTTTSRLLVRQRADYVDLLSSLTDTGRTFGHFVGTTQSQIIGLAADSRPTLRLTRRYASEFPCISRALVDLVPRVNKAFGVGTKHPGARVMLHVVKPVRAYSHADAPTTFHGGGGPTCPYVPSTALANTALGGMAGLPGTGATQPATSGSGSGSGSASGTTSSRTGTTSTSTATSTATGMGSVNSPQENRLIAELMAPQAGEAPGDYPRWASLLVGPALRGAQVSVK